MRAALAAEWLKLRRSRLGWMTALVLGVGVPGLTAGFMAAASGPADSPVALKVNAMLIGTGWTAYLGMSAQLQSVAMVFGAGLVTAWCFGREFTDHTLGGLFALPISRPTIAAAKVAVTFVWSALVCLMNITVTCVLAPLAGLTVPSAAVFLNPGLKAVAVGLCAALLATPLAFIASAARGYLPAIAALILIVVITQILSVLGVGGWFPYAAPSLWAGMGGQAAAALISPQQLSLIPLTGAAGIAATIWWWRRMQVV
jgi:ABC-2 type transport system permease protein